MKQYQTYKCNKCGNEVEVQVVGGGTLVCCGEPMSCITENLTAVNLMKAFAGESQARNKYDFFAEIAHKEGYFKVASFFEEAANNEKEHAFLEFKAHNKLINNYELNDTKQNLKDAAKGENGEHTEMYPNFSSIANDEGYKDIARLFATIGKVEIEHEAEYLALLKAIEEDRFFNSDTEEEYVCEVCGHVHRGKKAPKVCPLCGNDQEHFKKRSKDVTVG